VRIEYDGQVREFDLMKVTTEELRQVKEKMHLTVRQFLVGITEADVDAMLALKWVITHDGKTPCPTSSDPFPDYWQFAEAWNTAQDEAEKEEEETPPDPSPVTPPVMSTQTLTGSWEETSRNSSPSTGSPSLSGSESVTGRSDGFPTPLSSPTA